VIQKETTTLNHKKGIKAKLKSKKRDRSRIKKEHTFPTEVLLLTPFYSLEGTVRR
jgi:hypothetical protein